MILEPSQLEKINLISNIITNIVKGELYFTNIVISINGEGKDKFELSILSWDHSIRKTASGDDLEKCLNEIIQHLTIEIVQTHNKLQDQIQFLKKALDQIT